MTDATPSPRSELKIGNRVEGTVYRILPNRILLRLPGGIHGVIRQREFSWDDPEAKPHDLVRVGRKTEAVVIAMDSQSRHVELSLRFAQHDPWVDLPSRYSEGDMVEGRVAEVRQFGAFVEIETGVDALVPLSELGVGKKPKQAQEILWAGDLVRATVKNIDLSKRRVTLSMKDYFNRQVAGRRKAERSSSAGTSLARFLDPATARKLRQSIGDLPDEIIWPKPQRIRSVLVADDDELFREALSQELDDAGYEVTQTVDHVSTRNALKGSCFDLAILDLSMSEPEPLSLGEEVSKACPETHVLILSGFEIEEKTILRAQELGFFVDHKPFGARALAAQLRLLESDEQKQRVSVERSRLMRQKSRRSDIHFTAKSLLRELADSTGSIGAVLFRQNPEVVGRIDVQHSLNVRISDDQDVLTTLRYSPVGDVLAEQRLVLVNDAKRNPRRTTYLTRALDFRSCLGVPVVIPFSEQTYALFLFSDEAEHFDGLEARIAHEADKLGTLLLQQSVAGYFLNSQSEIVRSQLRAGALHDIRNALGSLDFKLDRLNRRASGLAEKPSPETVESLLLAITETRAIADQMKETTDLFRELSTSEEIELVEVNAVVRRIVQRHQPLASHLSVTLHFQPDATLPSTYMNLAHLQQVIDNLILNALQWSADRRDRRVLVESEYGSERDLPIRIYVVDTGPGIHRQLQEDKIFELGYSLREHGSGLGLFVARALTQAAGGKIVVESSIMEIGTKMLLALPEVGRDQLVVKGNGDE